MGRPSVTRVAIVGRGRVGGALAANLRGDPLLQVADPVGRDTDLSTIATGVDWLLLAVGDASVADVAASIASEASTLFVHFAGSLTLEALAPHARRASLHPLTAMPGDPEVAARRLRGSWMAIAGDPEVERLASALGGRTFALEEADRVRYHATATVAASHLAGLLGQVERNAAEVGVPFEAYLELARSTVGNVESLGARDALTGPIVRRDWSTVRAHLAALPADDHPAYLALAAEAARLIGVEFPDELAFGWARDRGSGTMDAADNIPGSRLTCSNPDCDCELEIKVPCPHGTTYTCACGHEMHAIS